MKLIPLTRGQFAQVDDEDFERLNAHKWHVVKTYGDKYYAKRSCWYPETGKKKDFYMHREIMGVTDRKMKVDHIHHDTLDNRKESLRVCTHSQNLRNRKGPAKNGTSGFRGVSWFKRDSVWHAQIRIGAKNIHLGYFANKLDAAAASAAANIKYFGEYGGSI